MCQRELYIRDRLGIRDSVVVAVVFVVVVIVVVVVVVFLFNDTATTEIYTRSLVGSVRCV